MKYELDNLKIDDMEVNFIHLENGDNVFADESIALMLGIEEKTVRKHQNTLNKSIEANAPLGSIRLKNPKTGRLRRYSPFNRILMIATMTQSKQALKLVGIAGQLLNEKIIGG